MPRHTRVVRWPGTASSSSSSTCTHPPPFVWADDWDCSGCTCPGDPSPPLSPPLPATETPCASLKKKSHKKCVSKKCSKSCKKAAADGYCCTSTSLAEVCPLKKKAQKQCKKNCKKKACIKKGSEACCE